MSQQSPGEKARLRAAWEAHPQVIALQAAVAAHVICTKAPQHGPLFLARRTSAWREGA